MTINIRNAEYQYKQGFHLKPVNLTVAPGTFVVLLGPNGSGKSTLFSLINGIAKPAAGSITVDGCEVSAIPARSRAKLMGMVPQVSKIYFDYSVEELVAMGRYPYQGLFAADSSADLEVLENVITRLDLQRYRKRSIQNLSGGEYQRVLLARVLVQQTDILLLDEPGNHLDLKHQTLLLDLLREEVDRGKTVVAVLHDLNQALHYADYGMLLDGGECITSGRPSDFLTPGLIKDVFGVEMKEYKADDGSVIFGLESERME